MKIFELSTSVTKQLGVLAILWLLSACSNQQGSNNEDKSQDAIPVEQARENLTKELQEALTRADLQINQLETKIAEEATEAKEEIQTSVDRLNKERQKVIDKIKEVAEASKVSWGSFEKETKQSIKKIAITVDSLNKTIDNLSNAKNSK
jgi:sugar-specific transcriptional regulator TrmB